MELSKPVGTKPERAEEGVQEGQTVKCEEHFLLGDVLKGEALSRRQHDGPGDLSVLTTEASWPMRCLGRALCGSVHPSLQHLGG